MPRREKPACGPFRRLSFAWWPHLSDRQARGPVVRWCGGKASTIVIEWPTDATGSLDADRLRAGAFKVILVGMSPGQFEVYRKMFVDWPACAHDFITDDRTISPARDCIFGFLIDNHQHVQLVSGLLRETARLLDDLGQRDTAEEYRRAGATGCSR